MAGFIFGGDTGVSYETLQRRRKLAEQLMSRKGAPRNVAEGLGQAAESIMGGLIARRTNKQDDAAAKQADSIFADALGGALTGGGGYSAPSSTTFSTSGGSNAARNAAMAANGGPTNAAAAAMDFSTVEQQYGLPSGYLARTAQIESSGNPRAQNPNSSAGGLFQFIDSTAKQYGLADRFDPAQATDAAARLARDNASTLRRVLGRDPTAAELYLAHQQGGGGAAKLLGNPNARAVDIVGADAVRLNGGNANMTAAEFAGKWLNKFGTPRGGPSGKSEPISNLSYRPGQNIVADAVQSGPAMRSTPGQQADIMPAMQGGGSASNLQGGAGQDQVRMSSMNAPQQFNPQASGQAAGPAIAQALLSTGQFGGQGRSPTQQGQMMQRPGIQQIAQAMGNPYIQRDPGRMAVLQALLQQQLAASQPMSEMDRIQLEQERLRLQQMQNPTREPITVGGVLVDPETYEPLFDSRQQNEGGFTLSPGQQRFDAQGNPIASGGAEPGYAAVSPEEAQALGLPEGAYQRAPDGRIVAIGGGGTNVTVNNNPAGSPMPGLSKLGEGMTYLYNPDGTVKMDEQGVPLSAPIPGTDTARDRENEARSRAAAQEQRQKYADVVLTDIGRAKSNLTGGRAQPITGMAGSIAAQVPGSEATDTRALVETVKANIGFDRLQEMRDASPTGGALGQVTERELATLQAVLGNLEFNQSKEQLLANLTRLEETYLDIVHGRGNWSRGEDGNIAFGGRTAQSSDNAAGDFDVNSDTPPPFLSREDAELWPYGTPEERAAIAGVY